MRYLDLIKDEPDEASRLYTRYRQIMQSEEWDTPSARSERAAINKALHRLLYCGPDCSCEWKRAAA